MRFLANIRNAYKLTHLPSRRRNSFSHASVASSSAQFRTRSFGTKSSGNSNFFKNRKINKITKRHLDKTKSGSMSKWRSRKSSSNIIPLAVISSTGDSPKIALIPINLFEGKRNDEEAFRDALAILSLLRDNGRQVALFTENCTKFNSIDRGGGVGVLGHDDTGTESTLKSDRTPILTEFEGHDEATFWVDDNLPPPELETESNKNTDREPSQQLAQGRFTPETESSPTPMSTVKESRDLRFNSELESNNELENTRSLDLPTSTSNATKELVFNTDTESNKPQEVRLSVGLPQQIAKNLKEIPVSGMQLNFEMDMTNVKEALLKQEVLPKLPERRRKFADTALVLSTDVRLDSMAEKTIPLHFNAFISGTVDVNPKAFPEVKLKNLQVPEFNEYVTAIAANLCSTALQKGFPTDISRKLYSTDETVSNKLMEKFDVHSTKTPSPAVKAPIETTKQEVVNKLLTAYGGNKTPIETLSAFLSDFPLLDCKLYQEALKQAEINRSKIGASKRGSKKAAGKDTCKTSSSTSKSGSMHVEAEDPCKKLASMSKSKCGSKTADGKDLSKKSSSASKCGSMKADSKDLDKKSSSSKCGSKSAAKSECGSKKDDGKDPCKKSSSASKSGSKKDGGKDPCKSSSASKGGSKKADGKDPCKKSSSASKCGSKSAAESKCGSKKGDGKDPCKKSSSASKCGSKKDDGKDPCKKSSSASKCGSKSTAASKCGSKKGDGKDPCKKSSSASKCGSKKDDGKDPCKKSSSASKCGSKSAAESKCGSKKGDGKDPCKKSSSASKCGSKKDDGKDPCKKSSSASKCGSKSAAESKCGSKKGDGKDPCKKSSSASKCGSKKGDGKDLSKKSSSASKCGSKSAAKSKSGSKKGDGKDPCKKSSSASKCGSKKGDGKDLSKKSSSASKCGSKSAAKSKSGSKKGDGKDPCKKSSSASKCGSMKAGSKDLVKKSSASKCGSKSAAKSKCGSEKDDGKDPCKKSSSASKCGSKKGDGKDLSKKSSSASKCGSKSAAKSKSGSKKGDGKDPCKKSSSASKCGSKKGDGKDPCKKSSSASKCGSKKGDGKDPCKKSSSASKCGSKKDDKKDPCKKSSSASKCGSKKDDKKDPCKKSSSASKCGSKKDDKKDPCKKSSSASKCGSKKGEKDGKGSCKKKSSNSELKPNCGSKSGSKSGGGCKKGSSSEKKPKSTSKRGTHTLATLSTPFAVKLKTSSCMILVRDYSKKCPKDTGKNFSPLSNEYRKETCGNYSWKHTRARKKREEVPKNCYPDETQEFCPDTACYRVYAEKAKRCQKKNTKKSKENKIGNHEALCTMKMVSKWSGPFLIPVRGYSHQMRHLSSTGRNNYDALIEAPYKVKIRNSPMPKLLENDVLISVDSVALSDSDIYMFETGAKNYPQITLGNEAVGVVKKVGDNVCDLGIGDHVVIEPGIPCCNCDLCKTGHYNLCYQMTFKGCLSKYCTHPAPFCHKISREIPTDHAAMVYQLAMGCNTCYRAGVNPNSNVVVIGSCAMSLCAAMCAQSMGAANVCIACGMLDTQEIAKEFITNKVVQFDSKMNEKECVKAILASIGTFPDIVINCSSNTKTMNVAIMALKPTGTCVIAGFISECASFNVSEVLMKEISVIPSFRSRNMFPLAVHLLECGRTPIDCIIANSCRWDELGSAFREALSEANCGPRKVIVQCQLEECNESQKNKCSDTD